jgi:hypothetical protein
LTPINGGCVHGLTTRDPGSERRELLYDQFAAFLYERYLQEEARAQRRILHQSPRPATLGRSAHRLAFCRDGFNAAANLTALRVRTGYRH